MCNKYTSVRSHDLKIFEVVVNWWYLGTFQDMVNLASVVETEVIKARDQLNLQYQVKMNLILTLKRRSYDVAKWLIYSNGITLKEAGVGSFCYVHFSAKL